MKQKMQEEILESKQKLEEFIHNSQFPKTQERRYKSTHEKACQTAGVSSSVMSKASKNSKTSNIKAKLKDASVETDPMASNVSDVTTPMDAMLR